MDTYLLLALITGGLLIAYSLFLYIFPSRRLNLLLKAGSDALNVLNLLFVYLYTNNALVVVGMAMNVICMIREILFSFRNNYKTLNNIGWPIGFSIVFEVKNYIIKTLGHSVTIFDASGGYSKENQKVLMCVIPTREYFRLKEGINKIDEESFFIVTDAYEVYGGK